MWMPATRDRLTQASVTHNAKEATLCVETASPLRENFQWKKPGAEKCAGYTCTSKKEKYIYVLLVEAWNISEDAGNSSFQGGTGVGSPGNKNEAAFVVHPTISQAQDEPCEWREYSMPTKISEIWSKPIWSVCSPRMSAGWTGVRAIHREAGILTVLLVPPRRKLAEQEAVEKCLTQWCAGRPPRRHHRCLDLESSSFPQRAGWEAVLAAAAPPPPPTKTQACVTSGDPTGTGTGLQRGEHTSGIKCGFRALLLSQECVMPLLLLSLWFFSLPSTEHRHFFLKLSQGIVFFLLIVDASCTVPPSITKYILPRLFLAQPTQSSFSFDSLRFSKY